MRIRRGRAVWWVAALCYFTLVAMGGYANQRGWTRARIERTVNGECPVGSDRDTIESFLKARAWSYTYGNKSASLSLYGQEADLPVETLSGIIFADVPDANVGVFDTGRISVFFFLDRDGRLVKAEVRVWLDSM